LAERGQEAPGGQGVKSCALERCICRPVNGSGYACRTVCLCHGSFHIQAQVCWLALRLRRCSQTLAFPLSLSRHGLEVLELGPTSGLAQLVALVVDDDTAAPAPTHCVELGLVVAKQLCGTGKLCNVTSVHDKDLVKVDLRLSAMLDSHRAERLQSCGYDARW
jgi:hypothetical protein